MNEWAAAALVLLAACGPATTAAVPATDAGRSSPEREIPSRELEDESFGDFFVTSYNLHPLGGPRVEVIARAEYAGEAPAQPECYLWYGGAAAYIEPRYLMWDLTKGDEFTIIGIASFSKDPPPIEAEDVVCRASGYLRG